MMHLIPFRLGVCRSRPYIIFNNYNEMVQKLLKTLIFPQKTCYLNACNVVLFKNCTLIKIILLYSRSTLIY